MVWLLQLAWELVIPTEFLTNRIGSTLTKQFLYLDTGSEHSPIQNLGNTWCGKQILNIFAYFSLPKELKMDRQVEFPEENVP